MLRPYSQVIIAYYLRGRLKPCQVYIFNGWPEILARILAILAYFAKKIRWIVSLCANVHSLVREGGQEHLDSKLKIIPHKICQERKLNYIF